MSESGNKPASARAPKAGKNRRKSRELALKGIYQGLMNQSELRKILRDMADDMDFDRADQVFFRQLIEGVAEHMPDQRRLSGAEKAGDDGCGNFRGEFFSGGHGSVSAEWR